MTKEFRDGSLLCCGLLSIVAGFFMLATWAGMIAAGTALITLGVLGQLDKQNGATGKTQE
jgi:hypothetical protein